MIGIKSIASYVPTEGVDNYAQGAKFGKDQDFIFGKIGSTFLPRKDDGQETSDLCVEAAKNLFAANPRLIRHPSTSSSSSPRTAMPKVCPIPQLSFSTSLACRPRSLLSISPWAAPAMSMASMP